MTSSTPILLVHGAWHGAWCWRDLIPALAARGRHAVAIDLPGAGANPAPPAEMTLERCARRVVEAADAIGRPVVLVGHSMGGMSVTQATEWAPDRFSSLVYLAALVPGDRQSMANLAEASGLPPGGIRPLPDESGILQPAPAEACRDGFYHDCPDDRTADAIASLTPIPLAMMLTPVRLPTDAPRRKPRHYIECTDDRVLPIASQRWMAAAQAPMTMHSLASGHSPFFSIPAALADILAPIE